MKINPCHKGQGTRDELVYRLWLKGFASVKSLYLKKPEPMNCPRCAFELTNKTILDFKYFLNIDYCPSCGGIWLDNGELSRLEKTIEPTFFEIRKIPGISEQQEELNCPCCPETLRLLKARHKRDNHVVVDYCRECKGIWLDTGEIEAIRKENWVFVIGKFFRWLVEKE